MLIRTTGNLKSSSFFHWPPSGMAVLDIRGCPSSVQCGQSGRFRAAISPFPAVGSAASAAARELPGVRSRPGLAARRRRAGHDPPPPRLPVPALTAGDRHGRGRPAALCEPGSRCRRQSRAEATVTATTAAETVQPGLRRAGAVPARHSAGGAAAPAPPPPRPASRAPAGSCPRAPAVTPRQPPSPARPRASGARPPAR